MGSHIMVHNFTTDRKVKVTTINQEQGTQLPNLFLQNLGNLMLTHM